MSAFLVLFVVTLHYITKTADAVNIGDSELVSAFMVHRHGDRTPVNRQMIYSRNIEDMEKYIQLYGSGQLTDMGKKRSYKLGQYIRSRYDELLGPRFNYSSTYIRSTDSTRAKMSVLAAMAGAYPPVEKFTPEINWVPVPYTTVDAKYDFNLAVINCPTYVKFFQTLVHQSHIPELSEFTDLMKAVASITSNHLNKYPLDVFHVYDLFMSQMSLGIPLSPEIEELLPDIEAAASKAMNVLMGNEKYIRLQAGVLLKEFIDAAVRTLVGEPTESMRIYSAHDFNVYSFMAVSKVPLTIPKYSSSFTLELRKVVKTGRYAVLPVFKNSLDEPEQYLQVEGCDALLCDLEQFLQIISKYAMNIKDWRHECGFHEDINVDISSIK